MKAQQAPGVKEHVSVANNACWAIGEIAVKVQPDFLIKYLYIYINMKLLINNLIRSANLKIQVRQEIAPIVMNVITFLVPILSNTEVLGYQVLQL